MSHDVDFTTGNTYLAGIKTLRPDRISIYAANFFRG